MYKRLSFGIVLGFFIAVDVVYAVVNHYCFGSSARQAFSGLLLAFIYSAVLAGLISAASRRPE
jgi:hypothetical protein